MKTLKKLNICLIILIAIVIILPIACKKIANSEYTQIRSEKTTTNKAGFVISDPALYVKRGDSNAVYIKSLDGNSFIRLRK